MISMTAMVIIASIPLAVLILNGIEKRFGSARAGWMSGFPLVATPALVLLAVENGRNLAADVALIAYLGVFGWLAFVVCYKVLHGRGGRLAGIIISLTVWGIAGWLATERVPSTQVAALMMIPIAAIGLIWGHMGKGEANIEPPPLGVRMILAVALVILVQVFSRELGGRWAGVVTTFPVLASALLIPVYWNRRYDQSSEIASGMLIGAASLGAFTLLSALLLKSNLPMAIAFVASLLGALITHFAMWKCVSKLRGISPVIRLPVS